MSLRILIPVDERLGSVRAINYIIRMKDVLKPVVSLITVYDYSVLEGHGILAEFKEKIVNTGEKLSKDTLEKFKDKLEKEDIYIENSYIVEGSPGEAICEEAEKLNVDLIGISPNNKSELTNIIMGSVTHYVIHHSNIPVLLIK